MPHVQTSSLTDYLCYLFTARDLPPPTPRAHLVRLVCRGRIVHGLLLDHAKHENAVSVGTSDKQTGIRTAIQGV